ncbi:bifunctional diguanylate cyclase/phosphodiesterase [Allopontixanthobacter sp.]|uniref:putative bifunctional diguanylate cyclase/phosphodiesterase n=1 Tax=Allopontixanthobacter sp. TaxID=2906452 RepID=UPI002ABB6968|nr:bifunctional diguanylate cyclase/phosphodiesterase [Allopontixanthobacter sp.]MDZ4306492.1 bifunctional diguanylate cyclase/phosphodiesterase [Allopontixanthobacter sp.]
MPMLVLTLIFVTICMVLIFSDDVPPASASALIIGGIATYSLAAAFLALIGIKAVDELQELGLTDSLSGLPNRRALHHHANSRTNSDGELAVALIDLDGFKIVNDLYGHHVGDQVIKEVATMLRGACGKNALTYRLGGDEFAIAMTGPLAGTILEGICRNLLDRLSQTIAVEDRRIGIGASVGLARSTPDDRPSSSELLRRADVAMYASKRGGKMRCSWFRAEFDRNLEAVRDMNNELRDALLNNEFRIHYQPLVDAGTRQIVAVESLLRWERPDGKIIGPGAFVPIAEETGLINAIGLWVLRKSCQDALGWGEIKLSVNISAAQLRNPEFPIQLGQIIDETGFPAERLDLEITETSLILDPVVAERSLDIIRGFGVNVVLDDFGTGYASIGFLRQFRFHKLKLDRSLIANSATDESLRAMMLSSISMARALNMEVTAEGVETEAQADLVRAAGCDHIQGWLYFKAMPASDIEQHLSVPAIGTDCTAIGNRAVHFREQENSAA